MLYIKQFLQQHLLNLYIHPMVDQFFHLQKFDDIRLKPRVNPGDVAAKFIPPDQVCADGLRRKGAEFPIGAIRTANLFLVADAMRPLIPAGRSVAGLLGFVVIPAFGIHIVAPLKQFQKQRNLLLRRAFCVHLRCRGRCGCFPAIQRTDEAMAGFTFAKNVSAIVQAWDHLKQVICCFGKNCRSIHFLVSPSLSRYPFVCCMISNSVMFMTIPFRCAEGTKRHETYASNAATQNLLE